MNIRYIMMTCGYVENASTSLLIFESHLRPNGFASAKEAVTELALDMHAKFVEEHQPKKLKQKKCCSAAKASKNEFNFCPNCGSSLAEDSFDERAFMDMIYELHGSTTDSYGEAEYGDERTFEWWPWPWPWASNIFKNAGKDVLHIDECAEEVLLLALSEARPYILKDVQARITSESQWDMIKEMKNGE